MGTSRLEAFSDGVLAIIITIMVLELKAPLGNDIAALRPLLPVFASYVLSFVYIGIYWNNHHHMLHVTAEVDGVILWANLHLLFWLSLVPVSTAWLGEHHADVIPTAAYGVNLLMAGVAYWILQNAIIKRQGDRSMLAAAVGTDYKGKMSPVLYMVGILLSFVQPWLGDLLYIAVAVMWLIPDRRIERMVIAHHQE
jgi:uncharacterized membrane protein